MAKLFREHPLPPIVRVRDRANRGTALPHDVAAGRLRYMFGRETTPGFGRFTANLYDGRSYFFSNPNSRRWRLVPQQEDLGRIYTGVYFRETYLKERGYWVEIPKEEEHLAGEAPYGEAMPIPFGHSQYRDINAQFFTMAGVNQDVRLPKPVQLITEPVWNGTKTLSTIQNKVAIPGDGFMKAPPPSHVMDPEEGSLTRGQWIDPVGAESIISTDSTNYFSSSSKINVKLKHGINHLRLWCPSGEYREFDTSDLENYKITRSPNFDDVEVSLPIKIGRGMATQWDIYMMPRRTQITSHWWDYYDVYTAFTHFIWGFHQIRNLLDRIPLFPVPYGSVGSDLGELFIDDWTYYVSRWHGGFSPPITNQHARPIGFQEAGGEENFDPALLPNAHLWEGDSVHGGDYSIEYAIKHGTLLKHNPNDLNTFNPFFAIIYQGGTIPIGYYARIALQHPGDLAAKIRQKKRNGTPEDQWFYVWHRTSGTISPIRTLNSGQMFYNWADPSGDSYQLSAALQIGGYA
jgi:hypothetical protein